MAVPFSDKFVSLCFLCYLLLNPKTVLSLKGCEGFIAN